jgi:hypothetical protein
MAKEDTVALWKAQLSPKLSRIKEQPEETLIKHQLPSQTDSFNSLQSTEPLPVQQVESTDFMGPIVTRTRCESNAEDHQSKRQAAILPKITIDFAGSFELKYRRAKARMKVWILVLTCLIVQTVHFQVTGKFDSKFCDDRGIPEIFTSDKQTSLHKADKDIRDRYASMDWDRITEEQRMDLHTQLRHQTTVQQHVWSRFQRAILPLISLKKKKDKVSGDEE